MFLYKPDGDSQSSNGDVDWMLSTDVFSKITFVYTQHTVELNSTGSITPTIISGTIPATAWSIVGDLPSEFSFDSSTGQIDYDTTSSSVSNGSFTVTATNPAGSSTPYQFDWSITEVGGGINVYTNNDNPYISARVSPSGYTKTDPFIKSDFFGRTTSTSNGTLIEDSSSPIYILDNGNGTYDYLINVTGYSYWMLYESSSTRPSELTNGLDSDLTTSLVYYLTSPHSDDFTYDSVTYPSDMSDIHYLTHTRYLSMPSDVSLNGFMSSDSSWSYGFELVDPIPDDGLGRVMFCRFPRNWVSMLIGHNSVYTYSSIGNGSSRTYTSEDFYPSGGFSAGDKIYVTYNGSALTIYQNSTQIFQHSFASSYFDNSSAVNSLEVTFGRSPESDLNQTSDPYFHGLWQGRITNLWLSNNSVEDGSAGIPAGATHSWLLNETSGTTFAANTGGLSLSGEIAS